MRSKPQRSSRNSFLPPMSCLSSKSLSTLLCPISANVGPVLPTTSSTDVQDPNSEPAFSLKRAISCSCPWHHLFIPYNNPHHFSLPISLSVSIPGLSALSLSQSYRTPHHDSIRKGIHVTWWNIGEQDKDHEDQWYAPHGQTSEQSQQGWKEEASHCICSS